LHLPQRILTEDYGADMAAKNFWQSMTGWINKPADPASPGDEEKAAAREESTPPVSSTDPAWSSGSSEIQEFGVASPPLTPSRPAQPSGAGAAGPGGAGAHAPDAEVMTRPDEGPEINRKIIDVIKTCYDPEIPVNIFELGLIYDIKVDAEDHAHVKMTLTAPNCPAAQSLPSEVKHKIEAMDEIKSASVEIVFDPPWNPNKMSDSAKLVLNIL
jgi:FeS assembly SUF system protein